MEEIAMPSPTNKQLAEKINHLEKKVDNKHSSVLAKLTKFETAIREQIQTFHDFMVGYEAVAKDRQTLRNGDGKINTGKVIEELIKIVVLTVTIIATLIGTGAITPK